VFHHRREEEFMAEGVLRVFDKPLCCPSGVCGPEPDEELVEFAADLEWLKKQGVMVQRFNPAQEPGAFLGDSLVRRTLQERGSECLPLLLWGDRVIASGALPGRDELIRALGIAASVSVGGMS
jgi:hypothetical protein